MTSFAQVLAAARPSEGARIIAIPETWHQGRTAYGGFSSALALDQARQVSVDLPPLRSAQIAMMAPLAGEVTAAARIMRQGRNAIWIAAEISGDKGVGLVANFVFMRPVESVLAISDQPTPESLIPVEDARAFVNAQGPSFLRHHFDVRFARPRQEQRSAELCWWVRPRHFDDLDPEVALLLSADALPPGVMPLIKPNVPVSTMHWHVNLLSPTPQTRDGWWLLRSTGDYARGGAASQRMAAWNSAGEPTIAGMQSIAVFG